MSADSLSGAELTRFLFAIAVLLAAAHAAGSLFDKFRLPRVMGELTGGMLLGPTVLGSIAPGVHTWLFSAFPGEGKLIGAIGWIGLMLLMFVSGFEIQRSLSRGDLRLVLAIVLGATGLCLVAGWFLYSAYDFSGYVGERAHELAFRLVLAIAIAVTSIPVISKIFIDLGIIHTRFAKVVIAAATAEDVILWAVLAVATGLAQGTELSVIEISSRIAITLAFFGVALFAAPGLLRALSRAKLNSWPSIPPSGFALLMCFSLAAVASVLNVNVVFGALVAGILLGALPEGEFSPVKKHVKDFSLAFFIPIYFAIVGLKLDLIHHFDFLPFIGFLAFATLVKAISTAAAAALAGESRRSSLNFGIALNARGGPGIVLASIALDLHIINEGFFSILVMTAVLTSLGAGYWLKRITMRDPAALGEPGEAEAESNPVIGQPFAQLKGTRT